MIYCIWNSFLLYDVDVGGYVKLHAVHRNLVLQSDIKVNSTKADTS